MTELTDMVKKHNTLITINFSAGSGGNAVGNDLYREMTGNRGYLGSVETNI